MFNKILPHRISPQICQSRWHKMSTCPYNNSCKSNSTIWFIPSNQPNSPIHLFFVQYPSTNFARIKKFQTRVTLWKIALVSLSLFLCCWMKCRIGYEFLANQNQAQETWMHIILTRDNTTKNARYQIDIISIHVDTFCVEQVAVIKYDNWIIIWYWVDFVLMLVLACCRNYSSVFASRILGWEIL